MTEISDLAEKEIKRTAEEAVREAVAEIGSELIYEKSLRESWEGEALRLETIATRMSENLVQAEKQRNLLQKIAIGEGLLILGVITGFILFSL